MTTTDNHAYPTHCEHGVTLTLACTRCADNRDQEEHLRDHLTDGRWHDSCYYCGRRRVHGGTGIEPPAVNEV